jgi:hypothetical protein
MVVRTSGVTFWPRATDTKAHPAKKFAIMEVRIVQILFLKILDMMIASSRVSETHVDVSSTEGVSYS